MNDSDRRQLADAVALVLRPHLERSEALRRTVALIGKWLCEEADRVGTGSEDAIKVLAPDQDTIAASPLARSPVEAVAAAPVALTGEPVAPFSPVRPTLPLSSGIVPLRLGDAVVHLPLSGTTEEIGRARQSAVEPKVQVGGAPTDFAPRSDVDLAVVEARCRLKAASCRLFIEKQAAGADTDAEFEARHRMDEMIAQAKAMPNCFLWVFWRERPQPDGATLSHIAENYEAHADAVALTCRIDESGTGAGSEDEVEAFHLLAEANSALRAGLADTWLTHDDRDQAEVHVWLKQETASRRVFVERHMTINDPADPANAADLRARVGQINMRLDDRGRRAKGIKSALGQIKYHAGQIVKNGSDDPSGHWAKIADAVARLGSMGVAATDRRIAEAVGSEAAALWPAEAPDSRGLSAVVGCASALAADLDADTDDEPSSAEREWSKPVLEVRALLRGKRIVVVGGERKGAAVERFIRAFDLADAEWVSLTEHGPSGPMRAPIHRPDTAVVVVIVKLAGHLHVDEARKFADSAGKPCILLSGGYNPERVANAVLDQASARLRR